MLLIIGLGNPGQKHEKQRHNIGFMAVDQIHAHESFSPWKIRFQALAAEGQLAGQKALLLKPTTFMNESGRAVAEAMRFYKIELNNIIVLYDELDLAPGKIRIKTGGGSGGHNGIRSMDAHIGKDYKRVRLGIGHPGHKDQVTRHVLGDFSKADAQWLHPLLEEIGRNSDLLAKGDDTGFMNKIALNAPLSSAPHSAKGKSQNQTQNLATQKPVKKPKGKSHIRQANKNTNKPKPPATGPMADMLNKLFGGHND